MKNPLQKWERKPAAAAAPAPAEKPKPPELVKTDTKAEYVAFSVLENGNKYLSLARAVGLIRRFNYNAVMEIADDGELGTQVAIAFNFGPVVFIHGRNLKELITGLLFDRVEVVREYDPKRWPMPETGAAVVTKIEIVTKNTPEEKAEIERRIEQIKSGIPEEK